MAATPSLTPSATLTPTGEVQIPMSTASELPPEPALTELYADNFDSGALYVWDIGAGWSLVPNAGGQALEVTGSDAPVSFKYNTLTDVAVQGRFQFDNGAARLLAQNYRVTLNTSGNVTLFRGESIIGTAALAAATPNQWRTIRLLKCQQNLGSTPAESMFYVGYTTSINPEIAVIISPTASMVIKCPLANNLVPVYLQPHIPPASSDDPDPIDNQIGDIP